MVLIREDGQGRRRGRATNVERLTLERVLGEHFEHLDVPNRYYLVTTVDHQGQSNVVSSHPRDVIDYSAYLHHEQLAAVVNSTLSDSTTGVDRNTGNDGSDPQGGMTWAPNRVYGRGIAPGRFGAGGNGGTVQRGRREGTPRRAPMATPTTVVNSQKKFVVIGNDSDVVAAMRRLFYAAQQTAAKTISKAWIKIVEPKKQSNHPYTKKDAGKPDWWPTGTYYQPSGQPFKVQHTEPDHIDRFQRVELLVHLIGLVVEPNERQHRSIQHLGLNVAVFEEAIRNEMTAFYAKSQKNAEKKVYIDEIMKLAVKQQSYKANQLDATTRVYYALSPESMPACVDEEEDSEQDTKVPPTPPSSTASPLDTTGALYNSNSESVPSSATTPFPIPYPPTVLSSDLSAEHAAYIGATAAGGGGQLRASGNPGLDYYGGHYAANRRSSSIVAQHGSSFNSPVTPVPMPGHVYEGWSHQAGPTNSGMYTFPHQPAEGQAPFAEDHDVEMRYEYDGLPGPYHQ